MQAYKTFQNVNNVKCVVVFILLCYSEKNKSPLICLSEYTMQTAATNKSSCAVIFSALRFTTATYNPKICYFNALDILWGGVLCENTQRQITIYFSDKEGTRCQ